MNANKALGILGRRFADRVGGYAGPFDTNLEALVNFKTVAEYIFEKLGITEVPETFVDETIVYLAGDDDE